ncbi:hypothetical protein C2W64_02863 [Brevibacillus laterosporus]|nr:hypothetical protein C2W64_02863 [Brevibacillus laterosporus]
MESLKSKKESYCTLLRTDMVPFFSMGGFKPILIELNHLST